jgi:hypothetical protein
MNHTITTNLNSSIYHFIEEQSKLNKITKRSVIETAIEFYKKVKLKNDIEKWLIERYDEYKSINSDFNDIQINSIKI